MQEELAERTGISADAIGLLERRACCWCWITSSTCCQRRGSSAMRLRDATAGRASDQPRPTAPGGRAVVRDSTSGDSYLAGFAAGMADHHPGCYPVPAARAGHRARLIVAEGAATLCA